jgi:hypothetical protein
MTERDVLPISVWKAYLDRVAGDLHDGDAIEHKNFRKSVVKRRIEGTNYHREAIEICLAANGEVSVEAKGRHKDTVTDLLPTAVEAAAIKALIGAASFHKSTPAPGAKVKELRDRLGPDGFYEFYDRAKGAVVIVQKRIETDDGKSYLPWSYWSDGQWRNMEPDGLLPFWKPRQKSRLQIMIHEGAKAAEAVTRMLAEKRPHPWAKELDDYEHWGRIGGAPNSHKSNWSELEREKTTRLVVVADNDQEGINAVSDTAYILRERHLLSIEFDSNATCSGRRLGQRTRSRPATRDARPSG